VAVKDIPLSQYTDHQRSPSGVKTVDWRFSKHAVIIHHTPNHESDQRGIFSSSCLKQNSSPDLKRPPRGLKREICFQLAPQQEPQMDKAFISDVLAVVLFFESKGGQL